MQFRYTSLRLFTKKRINESTKIDRYHIFCNYLPSRRWAAVLTTWSFQSRTEANEQSSVRGSGQWARLQSETGTYFFWEHKSGKNNSEIKTMKHYKYMVTKNCKIKTKAYKLRPPAPHKDELLECAVHPPSRDRIRGLVPRTRGWSGAERQLPLYGPVMAPGRRSAWKRFLWHIIGGHFSCIFLILRGNSNQIPLEIFFADGLGFSSSFSSKNLDSFRSKKLKSEMKTYSFAR